MKSLLILCCLVSLTASCSSFNRTWREAASEPPPQASMEGAWEGRWHSAPSGHSGKLRCVVRKRAESSELYDFHYWATWSVLRGDFEATYPVKQVGPEKWSFVGESDLGNLAGVYSHRGEATPQTFTSDYTSTKGDQGTFTMSRPTN